MSFKKILVAIDYSEQTPAVFEQAIDVAAKHGAKLIVFHGIQVEGIGDVAPVLGTGVGLDVVAGRTLQQMQHEMLDEEVDRVKKELASYSQQAIDREIETESKYELGDPGALICESAKTWEVDLIILGRRGRNALAEMFLGSVSNYVMHHAPCSVLVVQGGN